MGVKHTPGPWHAVRDIAYWAVIPENPDIGDTPFQVCSVCPSDPSHPDGGLQEANARLIAAAPEMIEGLQLAINALSGGLWDFGPGQDEHEQCGKVIRHCQAVINKATGENHE